MKSSYVKLLAVLTAGALLAGCGGSSSGTGQLKVAVTDAPVDEADSVVVAFTGIEVKPADGPAFMLETFDPPLAIDMLDLQDGLNQEIADATVPAGRYNWIRLAVNLDEDGVIDEPEMETTSYIVVDGHPWALWVPSGDQSGLKLVGGFIVPQGGVADFTIDFDLRKSVHLPMNGALQYVLKPALRIVDNTIVGSIYGNVDPNLLTGDASTCAVYAFEGEGVAPDDLDEVEGTDSEPLASADVKLDLLEEGRYGYRVAFLLPGPYTVALTCEADQDDPATDDLITFGDGQPATIPAEGGNVRVDFASGT
jgi:hypothetical protein